MNSAETGLKERAEARLGKILREKWRLDQLLGIGGMAAVYAATHRNGKQAAIKILHPEAALAADIKARFLREGYLANKVGHKGSVSILDDDVDLDGTVFLVMELLQGETLESRWERDRRMAWEFVLQVAHKVLDVLVAAHDKGIVHRDLKPANIFLDLSGQVKILDFGIARLYSVTPQPGATGRDEALGTPGFMPPEQARGRWDRVDGQSDIWALGATMYAIISGHYVHEAPTVNEQLLLAMTTPAPPLRESLAEAPEAVCAIVDRALRFDKAERYPDAQAMQQEIRDAYQILKGSALSDAPPISVSMRPRSATPEAPTLADNRDSTARPVGRAATTARTRRGLPVWALAGLGVAVMALAFGVFVGTKRSPESGESAAAVQPTPSDAPHPVSEPASPALGLPAELTAPAPAPPPSAAMVPSASASNAPRARPKPNPVKPSAASSAAPKPAPAAASDDDFFGRRR